MERDLSLETALQEIRNWVNMEHAFGCLCKQDSPEVVLTLEVLKAGKCFHTIISFDTGLTDTQEHDYLQLIKDFPIKDLLAADSPSTVMVAISNILHLEKLRNTNYPIERAFALVEAISQEFLSQLVKSLSVHKLMLVTFKEFERIISEPFELFKAWMDEVEKFKLQLRLLVKWKMVLKFYFKINLPHKKLEARLTQMKK